MGWGGGGGDTTTATCFTMHASKAIGLSPIVTEGERGGRGGGVKGSLFSS